MKNEPTLPEALQIMVADDHPVVLAGLVSILDQEPDFNVVGQARDGSEAVALWLELAPDVGVLDLSMPGLDGFEAIEAIRRADPDAQLVVLTTMGGDQDVYRALQAGASGFLLKDCARTELAQCLRRVSRGLKYLQPTAATRLAERVTYDALTLRESEVLQGLASGRSNRWIADMLGVAEGTVKTHVKSLLGKLEARSRTEAVAIGLRRGFVRSPGP